MAYKLENIKVLLVEDNKPMLDLLKNVLLSFGVGKVITSLDGHDAFHKFKAHNPDLVLTDWMMRPGDGIELGRKIRNDPKSPNQYVPIILMTGFSEKHRVISARDAGITEFIVKPFNTRDLYKRLHQIVENPRQYVRSESFFGPDRRRKKQTEYKGPFRRASDRQKDQEVKTVDMV